MRLRLPPLIVVLAFVLAPIAHAGTAPRIVGGTDAGAYPSMAALIFAGLSDNDGQFCGGTVIAPYAVLTAAHCVVDGSGVTALPAAQVVLTGKTDLLATGGQHLAVRQIVTHPSFDPGALNDDVAIVLLATPSAAPALERATSTPAPGPATAIGWGGLTQVPAALLTYASKLQEAPMPVQAACDEGPKICTAGAGLPGICFGDSGGPLLVTTGGVTRQAGIASAILTSDPSTPICGTNQSLFTDVSLYNPWIDAQLAPAVSGVAVSSLAGRLHVTWQRSIGGAEPGVVVTTSDGTFRTAPAGATSLDIGGLPPGRPLRATVTVVNAWGRAAGTSVGTATLATRPVATVRPRIRGTAKVGKKLTCGAGKWKATPAPTFAYGWRIGGKVSKKQRAPKLKLTSAMRGKHVSCVVTAKNPAAAVAARSVAVTVRHR